MNNCFIFILSIILLFKTVYSDSHRKPTKCETCKLTAHELQESLKNLQEKELHELYINYDHDMIKKSSKQYEESHIRLLEAITSACRNLLEYDYNPLNKKNLKKPSKTVRRMDSRMEIGEKEDSWNLPPVEIMALKRSCDRMVELYEEDIEDWYNNHKDKIPLEQYLCEDIVLKNEDKSCLKDLKTKYQKSEL